MGLILSLFKNQWCPACKQISPVVNQIVQEYQGKIELKEIDIVSQPELAVQNDILSVPTLIISKDGQVLERISGFISKDNLIKKLNL